MTFPCESRRGTSFSLRAKFNFRDVLELGNSVVKRTQVKRVGPNMLA